jgi:hypothetical protein
VTALMIAAAALAWVVAANLTAGCLGRNTARMLRP